MKIVINKCYGGFGLSDAAYERLIELGIPVRRYSIVDDNGDSTVDEKVIFDRELTPEGEDPSNDLYYKYRGSRAAQRYWESWIRHEDRTNPLVVQVVEELGDRANGPYSKLRIVEIPDDVQDWSIDDYDGVESVHESHRSW